MLNDTDLMKVQDIAARLAEPVTLHVSGAREGEPFDENLANTARQIAGVSANRILLEEVDPPIFLGKPSVTISSSKGGNIHYLMAPEGLELDPFLDGIAWMGGAEEAPRSDEIDRLSSLSSPVSVLALAATVCPHCPMVIRTVLSAAVGRPLIKVSVVDAVQFSDMAEQYKVRATPTVIINGAATLVGQVTAGELTDHILGASIPESLTETLDSMIKAGRASDAAALVCDRKRPDALLPIYLSQEFSVRMGALVALEEALEIDARCLDPIVDRLIELLSSDDTALRGDTAVLLGKVGDKRAAPAIKQLLEDENEDVRDAAEEALDELEGGE